MTTHDRLRILALLSRDPGLRVLEHLAASNDVEIVGLATNRLEPAAAFPNRPERPEFATYLQWAEHLDIDMLAVDTKKHARAMRLPLPWKNIEWQNIDILVSCSWAFLVPPHVLKIPRIAAINVHRGKLPDYAGAHPVRRALEAGEDEITITAHHMSDEYDKGEVIYERHVPVPEKTRQLLPAWGLVATESVKHDLLPHYAPTLDEAIWAVTWKQEA